MDGVKIIELPISNTDYVSEEHFIPIADSESTKKMSLSQLKAIMKGLDGLDGMHGEDGKDGVSIVSVEQTTQSNVSGGFNILTITLSDGSVSKFAVRNAESCNGDHELGGSGTIARIGEITLLASAWEGTSNPYSQIVNIEGVTEFTQVDLTPSVEQLVVFHEKDLAFVTENEGGVVTVYAIGQKPMNDYTIQVTMTEVIYD